MRVCMISFHSCPFSPLGGNGSGGMSVYLKELTSALVEEPDVRVDIFTRSQDPACSKVKDVSPRIRVIQVKGGPEKPVDRRTLYRYVPEFSARMEEHLLRESVEYDLIHSHYWLSGLSGLRIHRKRGWPLVHTYHTLDFMKKKAGDGQDHSKRPVSERLLAEYSDLIISPTDAEKQSLVDEYGLSPERVAVVYPGVNRRLFYRTPGSTVLGDPDSGQEACVFLYVGRIEPVKGLMDVVLAFDLMRQEAPSLFQKARLAVIGGGSREELRSNPEFLRIQKTVKENGLSERVEFLGSIPQAQLRRYYSSADALVVPSLYESFGLVVIEALACGTPVLVSRVGKMKSIVREGENGFSFEPGEPASLCQALLRFHARRKDLWPSEKTREDVVGRFSWEKTAEATRQAYESLIRKNSGFRTISPPGGTPQLT